MPTAGGPSARGLTARGPSTRVPSARGLRPLPAPTGSRVLEVLPALERALEGDSDVLLPVPEAEPETARRTLESLAAHEPLEPGEDDPADPTALVIPTSGSTGTPKGVLLSASALRASATATHQRLHGPGNWLLALPAHHIAGVQVLIRALISGTPPTAVETATGFRTDVFVEAVRRMPGNDPRYTSLVPTQLARLLRESHGLAALREFDAVLLGGAATSSWLLEQAREAQVSVITTYGMSETSGGCVYDGTPLPGARVHIGSESPVDGADGDHEIGRIALSGPMLARGYRHVPEAESFADGWFHTGDLGYWEGSRLEIVGRADEMIITGGLNIAPGPLERILTDQDEVHDACVLGLPDPEWGHIVVAAVVPADPAAPPSLERLRSVVRERASSAAVPKRLALLPKLPSRGPGKPDRPAVRALTWEALNSR